MSWIYVLNLRFGSKAHGAITTHSFFAEHWWELRINGKTFIQIPVPVLGSSARMNSHEEETGGYVSTFLAYFQDNWGMPVDGYVEVDRFDEVLAEMKRMKEHFVGSADDAEEKKLAEKIWPYEDHADA